MRPLSFSVVINTYNRAASLSRTLQAFRWQKYSPFEVVVVNGPSTDRTLEVLEEYGDFVKAVSCPVANLSVSRNIGISHAAGDVVAFIDDDGIPYPEWLQGLSLPYRDEGVGAVGGFVWDHTGMAYQTRYVSCDRFGEARFFDAFNPSELFSFPGASWYPSLMGVNSSFRRSALIEAGGFNEVYAYFLDETDVCLKIVDRGYQVVCVDNAKVHHKYLASHIRDAKRTTRNFYPIIRSKANFVMTHGVRAKGAAFADSFIRDWIRERNIEVRMGHLFGDYTAQERDRALEEIARGYADAMANPCEINDHLTSGSQGALAQFPALAKRLRIVIISADFPPMANGGIGTLMKNISAGLAEMGNEVHVISRTKVETVDFEDGGWVHRIKPSLHAGTCRLNGQPLELPASILEWAAAARERVEFIASEYGAVDVVVSPIWDLEGIAAMDSSEWKSVVTLHTTYAMSVDSHPEWKADRYYFENFTSRMIAAEREVLEHAPMLLANSQGLVDEMEAVYGLDSNALRLATVPHGVRDFLAPAPPPREQGKVRGLFVGRVELRKGSDVLFEVLPELFELFPDLYFDMVGDDTIPVYGAKTLLDHYRPSLQPYLDRGRLRLHGKVADHELPGFYNACDFFVAPSRFESFGLILAEAMSCGKPVIACRAGGMVEVVGDAGLLAEPGDAASLKEHMVALAGSSTLRERLGGEARSRFEGHFSVEQMARKIDAILQEMVNGKPV